MAACGCGAAWADAHCAEMGLVKASLLCGGAAQVTALPQELGTSHFEISPLKGDASH